MNVTQCVKSFKCILLKHKTMHSIEENSTLLWCMHRIVRGKNVTHIQRVLTELCCIMLDILDHSAFWGLFLIV